MAAHQFHLFDPGTDGRIELVHIAKAFAQVDGVTHMQAYRLAELILDTANTDYRAGVRLGVSVGIWVGVGVGVDCGRDRH